MKLMMITLDVSGCNEIEFCPVIATDDADMNSLEKEYYQWRKEEKINGFKGGFIGDFIEWLVSHKGFLKADYKTYEMWQ